MVSIVIVAASMWYYSTFNLATDYRHYALARALQGLGYGFFFVPVNVIAYSQLRPDQNNRASSLTNLFRNWGGSFGIAFITTAAERRHHFHQTNLGSAVDATSQQLTGRLHTLTAYLAAQGFPSRCGGGGERLPLPSVPTSGEPLVIYGLLPRHRMADAHRNDSAAARSAVQAGRKDGGGPLMVSRSKEAL